MTAQKDEDADFRRDVVELGIHMGIILKAIERLDEQNEGTLRTRGMKERLAIAEDNIRLNKEAFEKVDKHIGEVEGRFSTTLREFFTEITKKIEAITTESQAQKTVLQKWTPYLNVLAWLVTGAGGILLMLFLTGQIAIIRP